MLAQLRLEPVAAGAVGEQLLVESAGALNGLLRALAHYRAAGGVAGDLRVLDRGGEVVQSELVAGGRGGGVVGTDPAGGDLLRGGGVGQLSSALSFGELLSQRGAALATASSWS